MIQFTDDVQGTIIGGDYLRGQLVYDGRRQGNQFYAENEAELKALANAKMTDIRAECGEAFLLIYPNKTWELRIMDC